MATSFRNRVQEAAGSSTKYTEQRGVILPPRQKIGQQKEDGEKYVKAQSGGCLDLALQQTSKHHPQPGDGSTDFGKEGGSTTISMEEVHERLLPPYRAAVKAGVGAVMVSFNSLAGTVMHSHKALITDTLKNRMGFDGIVVSDWKGYSRFGKREVINARVDMVMAVDGDLDFFPKRHLAADPGRYRFARQNR